MKRDFFEENFEWFLRRNANQFRMKASDRVWNNISKELSSRRRSVNLTLSVFFLLTAALGYYFVSSTYKPLPVADTQARVVDESPVTNNEMIARPVETQTMAAPVETKSEKQVQRAAPQSEQMVTGTITYQPHSEPPVAAVSPFESPVADLPVENTADETVAENDEASAASVIEPVNSTISPSTIAAASLAGENPNLHTIAYDPSVTEQALAGIRTKRKTSWQISFTPTISYRKLGENRSYLRTAASLSASNGLSPLYSVNSAVTHKPDLGFEIGIASKHRITDNLKFIAGVQFNVNRYEIKAFNAPYSVATIRLNNGSSVSSVNTLTGISNTNGYNTNWLRNFYFQASVPFGLEMKLRGNEKMQFGLAGTIQPSYVLGDRAYLITSDYKNYVQVPWLVRRWNANTSLHTFVSYATGKMNLQVGPQVRYQLLSSFVSKYPVKENLFDFGMRIGISLKNE